MRSVEEKRRERERERARREGAAERDARFSSCLAYFDAVTMILSLTLKDIIDPLCTSASTSWFVNRPAFQLKFNLNCFTSFIITDHRLHTSATHPKS